MWRRRRRPDSAATTDPGRRVVVRPDSPALTGEVAARLASQVAAAQADEVVIDLSDISELDSAGVAVLADLVETPAGRVQLRGLPEATERMLGVGGDPHAAAAAPEAVTDADEEPTRLRATAVYRPATAGRLAARLETIVEELAADIEVVVIDLSDVPALDPAAVESVAFGSSSAAVRGMRMLIVNVPPEDAETLRRAGLSAQTWVAPPPLD